MQLRLLNKHRWALTSSTSFSETKPEKVTISSNYKPTVPSIPHQFQKKDTQVGQMDSLTISLALPEAKYRGLNLQQ